MTRRLLLLSAAAFAAAPPADARACSLAGPTPHVIDPSLQATDQLAPTLQSASAAVARGQSDQGGCLSQSGSSCDDIGTVQIFVTASDDMTPPARIGYRLLLTSGTPPVGLAVPADAIEPTPPSRSLALSWADSGTVRQQGVNFTLQVVAVDLAGNESAPVTVMVHDPHGEECASVSVAPGRVGPRQLAWFTAAALLLIARRRRARA